MRPIGAVYGAFFVVVAVTMVTAAEAQQDWPSRPISVVSPFAAGTTNDIVAHTVLDPVGAQIGQSFVLQNRPGGGGTVGVASVVGATPNGYTLLLSSSAMSVAVILHKSLPYDAVRDLQPIAMFGGEPSMMVGAPGKGITSVAALVAEAKANPGSIKFASVGIGSASYIAGERFSLMAGLNAQHVPYPGPGEALADLTAGRIDFYFIPVIPALPLITQGRVVPLAVSTPHRLQSLPGLPTLAESGYPVAAYLTWCGLSAPAKTPRGIVDKLNAAINPKVLAIVYNNRANAYISEEQYDLAIKDYDESIKADPTYARAFNNRGVAYQKKGDYDHAIQDFGAAISIDPNYANAFANRAETYRKKGDYADALKDFDTAIRLQPTLSILWNERCWTHTMLGDLSTALADCNQAIQIDQSDAAPFDSRGFAYLKSGQWDLAIADYNSALKLDRNLATALYGRGFAKLKKGDLSGGNADIGAAQTAQHDIAGEFARYGLH